MTNKFKKNNVVKHVSSGGTYIIMEVPEFHKVFEKTKEYYYKYKSITDYILIDGKKIEKQYIRCKEEMEDGRFILVDNK